MNNIICPNFANKQVFEEFNQMVEAFGGKPLSKAEYKSSELRNQRTGLDYSAMEFAYEVYHLNNGYSIMYAPNGENSILYNTLLQELGDPKKALLAKAHFYTNDYLSKNGDWMSLSKSHANALAWLEDSNNRSQLELVFKRNPNIAKVGTEQEYATYLLSIFPNSVDKSIYWHGTNEDFSEGFKSAKRGKGSGALETQSRNDFYLAKQAWSVIQYVDGINRTSVDKNGFAHWNKLWWELKEIMSNGHRENNDWKDVVIGSSTVRQAIPNKKGVFNRNSGGTNGKWLSERKADYGYENKTDKEFFEEILGVKWGVDTFNTWTSRNAEIFKSLEETAKGVYPAIINTENPIVESGQNTYYEEQRGLFTKADKEGNDAILGSNTDNEFNSDVAVVLRSTNNVHFLGTTDDLNAFKQWKKDNHVSNPIDINGEPYINLDPDMKFAKGIVNKFSVSSNKTFFGDTFDTIMSGETVSSSDIVSNILSNNLLSDQNVTLAEIVQKHSIPVKISSSVGYDFMTTYTDEHGQSIILINPSLVGKASNRLTADTFLHEVVHALTVNAFNNPVSKEDKNLVSSTRELHRIMDKLYPREIYDRSNRESGMYALTNPKEFIAEFISNKHTRDLVYKTAVQLDKQSGKTFLGKIKSLINSVTKFLVNKNLFKTNEERVQQYEKQIKKYLINSKLITYTKYKPSQVASMVYNKLDDIVVGTDDAIILSRQVSDQITDLEQNKAVYVEGSPVSQDDIKQSLDKMCDEVANILQKRMAAIRTSNLPQEQISQQIEILQSQIQQFKMRTAGYFDIMSQFMTQLMPQLLDDIRSIRQIFNENGAISHTDYMYQKHDNFGTYEKALDTIQSVLDKQANIDFIQDKVSNDDIQSKTRIIKNMTALNEAINKTKALAQQGKRMCDDMLITAVRKTIEDVSKKTHSLDYADYLQQLKEISYDTSIFFQLFGSLDKAKDNSLRTLFHIVDNAIARADMQANQKSVELLQLQQNLSIGERVDMLYEKNREGKTTGYLVRRFNYGQFYDDYNKFLRDLNLSMGLALETRTAPEDESEYKDGLSKKQYWNNQRNKWLSEHCERKFTKEYYDAYSKLSQITKDRREEIQSQIRILKEKALGNDGYYHYEKLTKQEYSKLQDLYFQKRLLKDVNDINGDRKTGVDLKIAQELQELDKLYQNSADAERNINAWQKEYKRVYEECGGDAEYDKGSEGSFDFKRYNEWVDRNCEKSLKRDENGKILLFKRIAESLPNEPVYEIGGDKGAAYNALKKQYNDLLNVRRDFATGDVRVQNMSSGVKAKLKELEKQMREIKKQAKKENKNLRLDLKRRALLYRKYTKTETTQLYKDLEEEARIGGYLQEFHKATGYMTIDELSDEVVFVPERWYTKILPRDEYMNEFYEIKPGKGWIDYENDNQFINPEFKKYESEGETMVPKAFDKNGKKLYDNSEAYNKATRGNLGKLYNGILNTMKDANSKYTNRQFHCDYLLPQVPGSVFKRFRAGRFSGIMSYIKEGLGVDDVRYFDIQYGQNLDDVLNNYDEFGELIKSNDEVFGQDTTHGVRPDGRELHMIPQYYTRKLRDPSQISSDIVGITCEYYKQALTFENKQQVKDQCEAILDMLEYRTVKKSKVSVIHRKKDSDGNKQGSIAGTVSIGSKITTGDRSTTYQIARQFLNTHLYNMKLDSKQVGIGWYTANLGKLAQLYRALTTAINLGCNIMVAGTGFLTSAAAHLVQQIVGRRYSLKAGAKATIEQIHQFMNPSNGGVLNYVANKNSKNKLVVLMETYNVSNQGSRKIKHTNRNRVVNSITENWCFGLMTSMDFIVKSNIMLTVLMSYQMYNGEFLTEEELNVRLWDKDKSVRKNAERERRKGIYLYDVIKTDSGYLEIEDDYKEAYKKIEAKVKAKINKWSEDADGMATETQKAAITTNFVGAAILTHRQYLPLMLQNRFGHTVEDMDVEMYEGGVFRSGMQAIKILALPMIDMFHLGTSVSKMDRGSRFNSINIAFGTSVGLAIDAMLISSPFSLAGAVAGAALGAITNGDVKSFFYDNSSQKNYALSRARRAHIKQIATELVLYHMFITPIINAIAAFADDDDDDKDKIAFAIVKYIAQLIGAESDDKAVQMAAYLGRRFQWEFYTAYRGDDLLNNIKTPSAQTGTNDKIESLLTQAYKTLSPRESLLDTFLTWHLSEDEESDDEIDNHVSSGLYSESELREKLLGDSRFTKLEKAIFKLLPFHHIYEQIYDSKSKRSYHENQIMKIKK